MAEKNWVMPYVEPGTVVKFRLAPSGGEWSYFVAHTYGEDALEGRPLEMLLEFRKQELSDGVLHVSDPRLNDPKFVATYFSEDNDAYLKGIWDFTDSHKKLAADIKALRDDVDLLKSLAGLTEATGEEPTKRRSRPPKAEQTAA